MHKWNLNRYHHSCQSGSGSNTNEGYSTFSWDSEQESIYQVQFIVILKTRFCEEGNSYLSTGDSQHILSPVDIISKLVLLVSSTSGFIPQLSKDE